MYSCLLYTSDAADEEDSVDLGGRRIIKKSSRNSFQCTPPPISQIYRLLSNLLRNESTGCLLYTSPSPRD